MVRTQISLTEEQYRFLKDEARHTGQSLSALIRKALEQYRSSADTPRQRALDLLGSFEADREDVSIHHDRYFPGDEHP